MVFRPREKILVGFLQACAIDVYDDIFGCYDIFFFETHFFTFGHNSFKVDVESS